MNRKGNRSVNRSPVKLRSNKHVNYTINVTSDDTPNEGSPIRQKYGDSDKAVPPIINGKFVVSRKSRLESKRHKKLMRELNPSEFQHKRSLE